MKHKGKRRIAALLCALLLAGSLPAGAAEETWEEASEAVSEQAPVEESKGYIFALRSDAPVLFQMEDMEGVEPISAAHGVYRADTLEQIENAIPAELLDYVVPDYVMEAHAAPTDPAYVNGNAWALDMLNMDYAWNNNFTGKGVRIGIVDSGVRRTHEELAKAQVQPGTYYPPGSEPEVPGEEGPDGSTRPTNAHGTFVAGLISAVPNNGKGFAGIAPGAEVIPLTAFTSTTTYLSAVCKAIYGGVDDYNCDILNMSLGIYKEKPLPSGNYPNIKPLDNAIAYADSKGVVLVASVGNDAGTMLSYPAAYPCVIGVGALTEKGERARVSQYNESVHVMAPGEAVYSLSHTGDAMYARGTGTSYAAPMVTAAIALAMERNPELTSARIMELLAATATDKGAAGRDDEYGYGLIDISAFLQAAQTKWMEVDSQGDGLAQVFAYYQGITPGKPVTILAAAYDAQGRMVDAGKQEVVVSAAGVALAERIPLDVTADAVTVKVFLWDSATRAPLAEPLIQAFD